MYSNNDFFQNINMDSNVTGDNNYVNQDMDVDINMMNYPNTNNSVPVMNDGVYQRVVNRTFVHEVPHVCPIHTRVINHHIFKHTYHPQYTCSFENVCSNVQCGSCCEYN